MRHTRRSVAGERGQAWVGDTGGVTGTSGPAITEPRRSAAPLADVHVVVVANDPDSRQILQSVLEYGGAVVSVTATARDALGVLARVRADVLLTDVALPVEDGYWLVQHLRGWPVERGGRVPVIAITAGKDPHDKVLAAGFTEHIPKPIVVDHLFRIIGHLAGRPAWMGASRGAGPPWRA